MSDETRNPTPDEERPAEERPAEERIGEFLRRNAALYNEPPATPREAMWSRIQAERGKGGAGSGGAGHAGRVIPLAPRRTWWLGAFAAAAVLALGIALGRISMQQETERQGPAGPQVASSDAPADHEPESGAREEPGSEPVAEVAVAADTAPPAVAPAPAATQPERAAPRRAPGWAAQQPQLAAAPSPRERRPKAAASDLYRLASQQMLARAEALLVQYRTDVAAERMDPAIGRWARDVLTSTRLLLDSPAADDPGMRDLLQDLELVLAQIVQRTGQADSLDDEMIDRTIEDRDLLPRLRGAIPAGVGAI